MTDHRVPVACWLLLAPVAVLFAFGMVRLHYNLPVFMFWIHEDGLVEWLTFAGLAAMAGLALARVARMDTPLARRAWVVLGLALLFGALEEISWGQRVFGWHSPAWFLQYNAQDETNLHNLVIGGVKVNRLVFGKMLGIAMALYLLLVPVLYRRGGRLREFVDRRALPMPRTYQVVLALLAWGLSEAGRSITGKAGEMQELGVVFVLLTVLLHPLNPAAAPPSRAGTRLAGLAAAAAALVHPWLTPRLRFLLVATAWLVGLFTLFRLAFAAAFEPAGLVGPTGEWVWDRGILSLEATGPGLVPAADVARAWILGLRFDLRMALIVLLPFALLGFGRLDPARSAGARRGWIAYFATAIAVVLLLHAIDLGQYAYEADRLNVTLLDHMQEAGTAAGMVWQTYPVIPGLLALALLLAASLRLLSAWLPAAADPVPRPAARRRAVATAAVVLYVLGLHGKLSQYPLRWSEAYFSPNEYVSALATNPLQSLFDSARTPLARVDAGGACAAQAQLASLYGLPACASAPPSFDRFVEAAPPAGARPNVVVVFLESFSAFKTGVMGNPLKPTPHFDALAAESVLFTRFYSASRPTARSIFAALFGIPDVSPLESASRNPRTVSQHSLATAFEGYRTHYFIGGSASWGNIRGMLAHNLPGLQLHEGEDELERGDVWGASDLRLLEDAHRVLAAAQEPFIAFIQTSGNHRPYTIPEDNRGFQRTALPPERLLAAGFEEPAAFDGMRFMDHALGHFMDLARAAPYYENTIFAFFGDHGSPARRFPPHEQPVRHLHVPLVLHAAQRLGPPRRVTEVASSIDVLPTLARLAGVPHLNTTLGRDLLARRPDERPFAYFATARTQGLVERDWFYGVDAAGRGTLHRALPDGSLGPEEAGEREPQRLTAMAERARALRTSAAWLLRHNAPRPHRPPVEQPPVDAAAAVIDNARPAH